jgi:hypothetical protein
MTLWWPARLFAPPSPLSDEFSLREFFHRRKELSNLTAQGTSYLDQVERSQVSAPTFDSRIVASRQIRLQGEILLGYCALFT